jgi:hypothetical protein
MGECMYRSTFLWPRHSLEVNGQLHASAALPLVKEPPLPIGLEAGWTPEPVWTTWRRENSWPYRDSNFSVAQPVASRYTDYAIPAPRMICKLQIRSNVELRYRSPLWVISHKRQCSLFALVYRIAAVSRIRSIYVLIQNVRFKKQHKIIILFQYPNLLSCVLYYDEWLSYLPPLILKAFNQNRLKTLSYRIQLVLIYCKEP